MSFSLILERIDRAARPALALPIILALALVARLALLYPRAVAYLGGSLAEYQAFGGSDVRSWMIVAEHFARVGDLSLPMLGSRPPLFPLSAAMVLALGGGDVQAALLQVLFGALTAVVGYLFARRLFQSAPDLQPAGRYALLVGVIMALDPTLIANSVTLLSEPLFNLLFALCLLGLAAFAQEQKWPSLILAAVALALSMLTRSTTGLFWLAAPMMLAPFVKGWWRPALVLIGVGLAVYLGWSWRNWHYAGVFTYSMQTNYQLLFYRAASAEHLATGAVPRSLYEQYIRQVYLAVGDTGSAAAQTSGRPDIWQFFAVTDPRLYSAMGQIAADKLIRYWPQALLGMAINVVRLFFSSDNLPGWLTPIEFVTHLLLYALAAFGVWTAYCRRMWYLLVMTLVPTLFVVLLTVAITTATLRMGSPLMICVITLAVAGLAWAIPSLRRYSSAS